MGNFRPLDTTCWIKFLTLHHFTSKRVKGSHFQWTKTGCLRPIPVWENEKQIPALHLKTGTKTIGCTMQDLYSWAETNC